jgi:hypothetical protein
LGLTKKCRRETENTGRLRMEGNDENWQGCGEVIGDRVMLYVLEVGRG